MRGEDDGDDTERGRGSDTHSLGSPEEKSSGVEEGGNRGVGEVGDGSDVCGGMQQQV